MLSSVDRAIIDLERTWWLRPGPKEWSIAEVMGTDVGSYYRRLAELLTEPAAHRYDPLTMRRLVRWVGSPIAVGGG